MKKIVILFIGMILLINTAMSQRYNGELYANQTGGDSEIWVIEDWSTIYGYYDDGYPIETSGYHSVIDTGYSIDAHFGEDQDIYYGLYKLSVNGDYMFIDFRDCHYANGDGLYGTDYDHPDVRIEYFPATHNFKSQDQDGGGWRVVANHGTVRAWEDSRKSPSYAISSGFGVPNTPTGFDSSLESTGGGQYSPKLDWNANTDYDIDAYQLWRKLNSGSWTLRATINHPTTTYTDYSIIIASKNTNYVYYKLRAKDWGSLYSSYTGIETLRYNMSTSIVDNNESSIDVIILTPEEFTLYPNSPNPFNPSTTISFALPEPSHVTITIFDITGKTIDYLTLDNLAVGKQSIQWPAESKNGTSLTSGVYLLHIEAIGINTNQVYTSQNKMHLLK